MKTINNLSLESASLTRTTAFLVTDKSYGYMVFDAACIIPVSLGVEAVVSARIETSPKPQSRIERVAANPHRLAALKRARARIAKALPDEGELTLAKLRLQAGMSQADLASLLNTQQPAIARLERGEGDPKLSTLQPLANALGVDVGVVVDGFMAAQAAAQAS